MVILNSGTATTTRLYGDNYSSYNKIIIRDDEILSYKINTKTGLEKILACYSIDQIKNRTKVPVSYPTY
jgi:hypothetical protein